MQRTYFQRLQLKFAILSLYAMIMVTVCIGAMSWSQKYPFKKHWPNMFNDLATMSVMVAIAAGAAARWCGATRR